MSHLACTFNHIIHPASRSRGQGVSGYIQRAGPRVGRVIDGQCHINVHRLAVCRISLAFSPTPYLFRKNENSNYRTNDQ